MTRKKQGAPQKLNAIGDNISDGDTNISKQICTNPKQTTNLKSHNLTDTVENNSAIDCKISDNTEMDSSCEKLLAFTKSFLPPANQNNEAIYDSECNGKKWNSVEEARLSRSPTLSKNVFEAQGNPTHSADELELLARSIRLLASQDNLPTTGIENKEENKALADSAAALPSDMDLSRLSVTQKILVDAMLRQQRQYYDQCSNNWMSVQRSDNNCLSKSKAERYRWCVQGSSDASNNQKATRSTTNGQSNTHSSPKKVNSNHSNNETNATQEKLFSQVFSGASKFHCRDCRKSFNTLVDLTVHMNKTGHFRDTNDEKSKPNENEITLPSSNESFSPTNAGKIKKRPLVEEEQQSEKVLTCMGCGNLFESLQDLSVHMIKTKHYENVPALRMWTQKQDSESQVTLSESEARKRMSSGGVQMKYSEPGNQPASSLATSPPFYFPNMAGSDIFGMANPAAAAASYASMLYTAPWLASTFFPQLMYPYGFAPPYPPSLVPMVTDEDSTKSSCTECKREFPSFKQLAEHISKTRHFPSSFGDVTTSRAASDIRHNNTNSKTSYMDQNNYRQSKDNTTDNSSCKSTRGVTGLSPTISNTKSYIQPSSKNDHSSNKLSSFDFIKSLESTIQSAISKVESPHSNSAMSRSNAKLHPNQNNAFAPFSSSIKTEKNSFDFANRFCLANKNKRNADAIDVKSYAFKRAKTTANHSQTDDERIGSRKRGNGHHSPISSKIKKPEYRPCDSPLDLTVKTKKEDSSPEPIGKRNASTSPIGRSDATSVGNSKLGSAFSSQSNPFAAYNGSVPSKDPLQSLKENMQSFLSLVGNESRTDASTRMNAPTTKDRDQVNDYRPLMIDSSPTSDSRSTNPLREMLKIVNNADLEKTRPPPHRCPESLRKRSLDEKSKDDMKKANFSLLRDLVIPKEDSSSLNPLKKLQDLVDWNASPSPSSADHRSTHSHRPSLLTSGDGYAMQPNPKKDFEVVSNGDVSSNDETSLEVDAASSLLSLKRSRHQPDENTKSLEPSDLAEGELQDMSEELEPFQEIHLQLAVVENLKAVTSDSVDQSAFEINGAELEQIAKLTDLKVETINTWFRNQKILFNQRSNLSFFHRHGDQRDQPITFRCLPCRQQTHYSCAKSFATHLSKHLESGDDVTMASSDSLDPNYDVSKNMTPNGHHPPFDGDEKHEYASSTCYRPDPRSCAEDSLRNISENAANLDDITVSTPPPSDENLDDDDVLDKVHQHARARPVADDVIGVTG